MKSDKWFELTNGVCWSIIFSLAAIIMSIAALARTHPRVLHSNDDSAVVLGFDYIGVIVAILALLVTFLVAWQIYNTLKVERKVSSMEDNMQKRAYFHDARVHFTQGLMMIQFSNLKDYPKRNFCIAYRNFFDALKCYLQSEEDTPAVKHCLSNMEGCLKSLNSHKEKFDVKVYVKCDDLFETVKNILNERNLVDLLTKLNELHDIRVAFEKCNIDEDVPDFIMITGDAAEDFFVRVQKLIKQYKAEEKSQKNKEESEDKKENGTDNLQES